MDFADAVKGSGPLPIGTACDFIRQAALGLHHAHQRGLIHRDIKPSNLLVSRNPPGVVKILDLGLARPQRLTDGPRDGETALTLDGSVVGTPDYMSPEQGKNSSGADHRSDLYSLGCTLYFLLTADVPFPKGSAMEKLIQHQLEEPCPIEMLRDEIPEELIAVLRKMMAKKPEDRYQSGEEVAAALEPFCRGASQPIQGSPASSLPTRVSLETPTTTASPFNFGSSQAQIEMSTLMLKKQDRRQWIIIGGAVLAMLLAILIISITSSGKNNRKPPDPPPAPKTPNKHVGRYNLLESATLRENLPCPPRFLRSTAVPS